MKQHKWKTRRSRNGGQGKQRTRRRAEHSGKQTSRSAYVRSALQMHEDVFAIDGAFNTKLDEIGNTGSDDDIDIARQSFVSPDGVDAVLKRAQK